MNKALKTYLEDINKYIKLPNNELSRLRKIRDEIVVEINEQIALIDGTLNGVRKENQGSLEFNTILRPIKDTPIDIDVALIQRRQDKEDYKMFRDIVKQAITNVGYPFEEKTMCITVSIDSETEIDLVTYIEVNDKTYHIRKTDKGYKSEENEVAKLGDYLNFKNIKDDKNISVARYSIKLLKWITKNYDKEIKIPSVAYNLSFRNNYKNVGDIRNYIIEAIKEVKISLEKGMYTTGFKPDENIFDKTVQDKDIRTESQKFLNELLAGLTNANEILKFENFIRKYDKNLPRAKKEDGSDNISGGGRYAQNRR